MNMSLYPPKPYLENPIMNEKKKQAAPKQKPEHVIRRGEVAATIDLRQSNCGYVYYGYSLGKSWRSMTTGKETHGSSFFAKNEEDIIQVVREASAWIREKMGSASSPKVAKSVTESHPDYSDES